MVMLLLICRRQLMNDPHPKRGSLLVIVFITMSPQEKLL